MHKDRYIKPASHKHNSLLIQLPADSMVFIVGFVNFLSPAYLKNWQAKCK